MQVLVHLVAVVALTAIMCLAAFPISTMPEGGGKLLAIGVLCVAWTWATP